ncbi:lysophospholipid acyltransferase family protein [Brevibacillus daliensis]|uniref:lysophospholipid acyltransferase family protein n=1 Tax=Brevibacillus daliensis TaxID=2892995 RepID=UPI001E566F4C|nr:lysophospholipid acyltransferase family protein [Brevibacillus daliensis]
MNLYKIFRSGFRFLLRIFYKYEVVGSHHLPTTGPVILCANHISNWDPMSLGGAVERQVCYMAKAELFDIPVVSYLVKEFGAFPVKRGGGDRAAIRATMQILDEGKVFGIFPEGSRSKTGEVGEGKSGVALFALKSDAAVVPVAIIGPYRLFRKVKVVVGKPLDLSPWKTEKPTGETMKQVTDFIMDEIRRMIVEHK